MDILSGALSKSVTDEESKGSKKALSIAGNNFKNNASHVVMEMKYIEIVKHNEQSI